ncbi:RagB/SusD family nutrient uptake outer membrane protein [Dyadobacter sp. LHD-138]|uniref:RagB/SusD family nutrient uptake outer membrane protein n=1 Tax=Dyadobacter sp. LHD-138 TaxID=3071413 RepID=UPI0027DF07C1|nr:RagB/SusD family nutrient uptake outer membrane protein [Dyadobacter sp. LHD-138]MDQ6479433.1 RagB/SusD family nutrient uptake outer membrane protein [Dyadobacter sp. LHD-138]
MKKMNKYMLLVCSVLTFTQCQSILDVNPKGIITEEQISEPKHVDGLVTAAYAFIPRAHAFDTMNPWIASFRSDDAYKGGGGLDDQTPWFQMETYSLVNANVGNNDGVWFSGYSGISRVNTAINAIKRMDEAKYPQKNERIAEMRFLRGWIHLKLKRIYRWIPYVTEENTNEDIVKIPNRPEGATTDMALWQKVYDDLKFAADNLPATQTDKGRINKYGAKAFLAYTVLWMAYPQDDRNQLTTLDNAKLTEALALVNEIIDSGKYKLATDIAENFMLEYDNASPESLWELQFTINDGTVRGNLNEGNGLTAPWWNPYFSCCDFHKPSYNMVNAFKVDANGYPLFNTFNNENITNKKEYFAHNTWDPRLGHTVAIPGHPWKYQTVLFDSTASRQPAVYGYFHSLKENVTTNSPGLFNAFWMFNSKNQLEVRYAEVLLWKAEILIQLGRHMEALPVINQIRERAAHSVDRLKMPDGTFPVKYKVEPYVIGADVKWDKEFAWNALMWEARLEMAMEGRRFFDLVRWGLAAKTLNGYLDAEKKRRPWLEVAKFTAGRDEYLPIPQAQMNWSRGVYKQNPGY